MPPIKSMISRVLRAKTPVPNQIVLNTASRGLTRTAKNATSIESAINPRQPTPFLTLDHYYRQPFPSKNTQRPLQRPASNQFSNLINDITTSLSTTPKPDVAHLTKLLRSYISVPEEWTPFAFPDASAQYTRNLVAQVPGVFNLLLLVWTPGKASPVHDHADAHCLMKVLKGELRERRYAIPTDPGNQGPLCRTSELRFKVNQVSYMADVLGLHEVANPSNEDYAMSLHLYAPPNAAMRGCHVYDIEDGGRRHVMQGAWHSVGGRLHEH